MGRPIFADQLDDQLRDAFMRPLRVVPIAVGEAAELFDYERGTRVGAEWSVVGCHPDGLDASPQTAADGIEWLIERRTVRGRLIQARGVISILDGKARAAAPALRDFDACLAGIGSAQALYVWQTNENAVSHSEQARCRVQFIADFASSFGIHIQRDEQSVARIAGTTMKVRQVVVEHYDPHWKFTVEQIFRGHYEEIPREKLNAALTYYDNHREEIAREIQDEAAFVEHCKTEMREPPAMEKLRQLRAARQ